MADLDEMSMMLGEIRSDLRYALKWFDDHENKDQDRFEKLSARIEATNGMKERVNWIEATVKKHDPVIGHVKRLRWLSGVTVAIVITVSSVAGNISSYVLEWFSW